MLTVFFFAEGLKIRIVYSFLDVDGLLTVIKNLVPGWVVGSKSRFKNQLQSAPGVNFVKVKSWALAKLMRLD